MAHLAPWLPLVALAAACTPTWEDTGAPSDTGAGDLVAPVGMDAWFSEHVPNVPWIRFPAPDGGGLGRVQYGLDGSLSEQTPAEEPEDGWYELPLLGLKAGRAYTFRAQVLQDDAVSWESGLGWVALPPPPPELSGVELVTRDPERAADGYVLMAQLTDAACYIEIIDRDGDVVWYQACSPSAMSLSVTTGTHRPGVMWAEYDRYQALDIGKVRRVAIDGSASVTTDTPLGHHDFAELSGDRIARVSTAEHVMEWEGEPVTITYDQVTVIPEGSQDPSEVEVAFDLLQAWGRPLELIRTEDDDGWVTDWSHVNSLVVTDTRFYLLSRNHAALSAADRATGTIDWVLGGPYSDYEAPPEGWWSRGHTSSVWDGGMMLFDNGVDHEPQVSRATAWSWDEAERTATLDWEHQHDDALFAEVAGDVRPLDSGDVLIAWSTLGLVQQVSRDHEVVWEVATDVGAGFTRARLLPDLYALRSVDGTTP